MRRFFLASVSALACIAPPLAAQDKAVTPNDIIAAAPAADWAAISAADLVVMDLAAGRSGETRRVIIQLLPAPFSPGWTDNIRRLVSARWFDGLAVVRVQDNYVVQWGDPDGETPGKARPLPSGLREVPESEYVTPVVVAKSDAGARTDPPFTALPGGWGSDPYIAAPASDPLTEQTGLVGFSHGWPVGLMPRNPRRGSEGPEVDVTGRTVGTAWPLHCYGMVGVARGNSPNTGNGAELYAVIGQAPRQLDRNIALVGRVIAGIEHLSSLPRGTGPLGFYETAPERTTIASVRMGTEVPGLPAYEYLGTGSESFAAYALKRANRKDDFYIQPAGGIDICNVPVPVRAVAGKNGGPRR